MARYRSTSRSRRPSKRRGLTAAQQAAHDKAYEACDHTITGSFSKGAVVADASGQTWKVVTYGIRYHEDVASCIYGVQPTRGPKGWKETCKIRDSIREILTTGTHTPKSRGAGGERTGQIPECKELVAWQDKSVSAPLATMETLYVCDHDVVRVVQPIYDDSPLIAWVQDKKLNARLWKAVNACPQPILLPQVSVRERNMRVRIDESSPRWAAYAAARDAKIIRPEAWMGDEPTRIELPMTEYRRIKSELDAASPSDE